MAHKYSFSNKPQAGLMRRLVPWLGISVIVILLDQVIKIAVRQSIAVGARHHVLPFFDLTLLYNRGIAFSLFASSGGSQRWIFVGVGIIAAIFIISMLARYGHQRMFALGLALILGGALGNVIDRLVYGQVVDFLLFYWGNWYFPAFNIADSGITVGAALLILDELRRVARS